MARKKKMPEEVVIPASSPNSRILPCALTDEELLERAQRVAQLQQEQDAMIEEAKADAKARKAAIAKKEGELRKYVGQIRTKSEFRSVECEGKADFEKNTMSVIRLDTGEVIHERAMAAGERQELLFKESAKDLREAENAG